MDHPTRAALAELFVTRTSEELSRGTGYLVAPGWVLTAAHVVDGATSVRVWLGAPTELRPDQEFPVDPASVLVAPDQDLALVPLPFRTERGVDLQPILFGSLAPESSKAVPVVAAGFPVFKLRPVPNQPEEQLREVSYAAGSIIAGANAKTGTLAFSLTTGLPKETSLDDGSPWAGMSGAAVWANGRLVGVVGQHFPEEGTGTLTVRPFASVLDEPTLAGEWRLALPLIPEHLEVVTPPSTTDLAAERAAQAAGALAPRVLIARESELAALNEFSASSDSWRWVVGDAFAGKTALLAWFALHPPSGVEVVACFLRRTVSGENTAEYVLAVLGEQLAALAAQPDRRPPEYVSAAASELLNVLLPAANRASRQRGHRLLLVIDGLDEYETGAAAYPLAGWLPDQETLPSGAALLVSSRAAVDVDLPAAHPLRQHRRSLTASDAAAEIQALAEREIRLALGQQGRLEFPVIGFLAASGGGLTREELRTLLRSNGRPTLDAEMKSVLRTTLNRSVSTTPDPDGLADQVLVFAHDALAETAHGEFANDLPEFRDHLQAWAGQHAARNWPPETPRYLLLPYARMLAARANQPDVSATIVRGLSADLFALGTNRDWLLRILERTGNPAVADQEILAIQRALLACKERHDLEPDEQLYRLAALALRRRPILADQGPVTAMVAAVWAALGRTGPALTLAASIDDRPTRAQALAQLAAVWTDAGSTDQATEAARRAVEVAASIGDSVDRATALAPLVGVLAAIGLTEHAERAAEHAIDAAANADDPLLPMFLASTTAALAQAGLIEHAARAARLTADVARDTEYLQGSVVQLTALAAALAGDHQQALDIAHDIDAPEDQAAVLEAIALALAQTGQTDRARAVAADIDEPGIAARALAAVALSLVEVGRSQDAIDVAERAVEVATTGDARDARVRTCAELAGILAQARMTDQAWRAAGYALTHARHINALGSNVAAAGVATASALVGRTEDALAAVAAIRTDPLRASTMKAVVTALPQTGQVERILDDESTAIEPELRVSALAALAQRSARAGEAQQADRAAALALDVAEAIAEPRPRAEALAEVACTFAVAGNPQQASRTAAQALDAAVEIIDHWSQRESLRDLVTALTRAGHSDLARRIAPDIEPRIEPQVGALPLRAAAPQVATTDDVADEPDAHGAAAAAMESFAEAAERPRDDVVGIADETDASGAAAAAMESFAEAAERLKEDALRMEGALRMAAQWSAALEPDAEIFDMDPTSNARRRADRAETLALAGRTEQALEIAASIDPGIFGTTREIRERAFSRVANALAKAGHTQQAFEVAASIENPEQRAKALVALAHVLAESEHAGRAEQAKEAIDKAIEIAADLDDPASRAAAAAAVLAEVDRPEAAEILFSTSHTRRHLGALPARLLIRLVNDGYLP
jgi:tetratricopeptide (TPR) repeat protein